MKALVITIAGNEQSKSAADRCIESSKSNGNEFEIEKFKATIPEEVKNILMQRGIVWNYPWTGEELDLKSGMLKSAYETADPLKRIACFLSHWRLWNVVASMSEPRIILEHDAIFTSKVDVDSLVNSSYQIIGLNNPIGATRQSQRFHEMIQSAEIELPGVVPVPTIDKDQVPQGLAGNSAYMIKPEGARKLLKAVRDFGAWPNDAIMCKQLLPGVLGCSKPYYTAIQTGLTSSTTR